MWKTTIDELHSELYNTTYSDMRFIQFLFSCKVISKNCISNIVEFTPNLYLWPVIDNESPVLNNRNVFNDKILETLKYFPKEYLNNVMDELVLGHDRFYEEPETTYRRLREILDALD